MKKQDLIEKISSLRKKLRKDTSPPCKLLYCKFSKRNYKIWDYSEILWNYKMYIKRQFVA